MYYIYVAFKDLILGKPKEDSRLLRKIAMELLRVKKQQHHTENI